MRAEETRDAHRVQTSQGGPEAPVVTDTNGWTCEEVHFQVQPSQSLRIAVDFDGVLFDHVPHILRGFRDAHGIDLAAEGLQHWDFFQYRAVREEDLSWNCVREVLDAIETDPALHRKPPRDPHARTVMGGWIDAGHRVDVVTARGEVSREVTELFLEENGLPYGKLVMEASMKTGYDVLVDDSPHNVLRAAADGSVALLMDHPYNQDVPTPGNPMRVVDWLDVQQAVPTDRVEVSTRG